MRTPADCINALNGCVRVGNPKRWTLGLDEEIANDIIANLNRLAAMDRHCQHLGRTHHTGGWHCPECGQRGPASRTTQS